MAHQPGSIAWEALTSNLSFLPSSPCSEHPTLHLLFKPSQSEDLNGFTSSIARTIQQHSALERKKYPGSYPPPAENEIILDDCVTRKISPLVWEYDLRQWLNDLSYSDSERPDFREEPCEHRDGSRWCDCTIPRVYRTIARFLVPFEGNDCYEFTRVNGKGFFAVELLKLLLLYGEMDAVLRIASQPGFDMDQWWCVRECNCMGEALGWDRLVTSTLQTYIGLNTLLSYRASEDALGEVDYRRLSIYRNLLTRFGDAQDAPSEFILEPHQQMLGLQPKRLVKPPPSAPEKDDKVGSHPPRQGLMEVLEFESSGGLPSFAPTAADRTGGRSTRDGKGPGRMCDFMDSQTDFGSWRRVSDVDELCKILSSLGLPAELTLDIAESAHPGYGKLRVPGDPLHQRNAGELRVYLQYCWDLLVRCDMMARASGKEFMWASLATDATSAVLDFDWCERRCSNGQWIVEEVLSREMQGVTVGDWYERSFQPAP